MTTLTLIGSAANMIGTVIAFFFGYPQPSHEESTMLSVSGGTQLSDGLTAAQYADGVRKRRILYKIWSRTGLVLMFLGFLLQFVAVSIGP